MTTPNDPVMSALASVPKSEWPARTPRLALLWFGDASSKANTAKARAIVKAGLERGLLIREGVRVRPAA